MNSIATPPEGVEMIALAARPGGAEAASEESASEPIGVRELIETIKRLAVLPARNLDGPFLFSVDHCFLIKGQGTARCAVFDRNLHSRMQLAPTPARLKRVHACDQWHSSRVITHLTGWHCTFRPNTEGVYRHHPVGQGGNR
jgi:hypothetical protein